MFDGRTSAAPPSGTSAGVAGAVERDGIVRRLPPAHGKAWGDYALTERGEALVGVMDAVAAWGEDDLRATTVEEGADG